MPPVTLTPVSSPDSSQSASLLTPSPAKPAHSQSSSGFILPRPRVILSCSCFWINTLNTRVLQGWRVHGGKNLEMTFWDFQVLSTEVFGLTAWNGVCGYHKTKIFSWFDRHVSNTSLTIVLNLWCVLKKVIANKLLNTNRLSLGQLLDESDWIQVSPTETHHHSSALMCTLPVVQFRSLIWIWHTKIRLSNAKVNYFCVCLHQTGSVQTRLASTDIFDMIPFSPESPIIKRVNCNGISSPKERGESLTSMCFRGSCVWNTDWEFHLTFTFIQILLVWHQLFISPVENEYFFSVCAVDTDLFGAEPFDPFICGPAVFTPDIQSKLDEMQVSTFTLFLILHTWNITVRNSLTPIREC